MKVYNLFSQMMQLIHTLLLSLQRGLDLIVQDSHLFHQKREEKFKQSWNEKI